MTTQIQYALMAGASYISTRDEKNQLPAPFGWVEQVAKRENLPSGFEATYFKHGSEIVISFAGSDPGSILTDWAGANGPLALGVGSMQLNEAALYYLQVMKDNPGKTISFTGHSLGGGLAALMGVMFNRTAVTFDQAPLANSASTFVRDRVIAYLNDNGFSKARLAEIVPELISYAGNGDRSGKVTGLYVEGEFLQAFSSSRIGTQVPLTHGDYAHPTDLHDQALLTTFLQSPAFEEMTRRLPSLLSLIFDKKLFAYETSKDKVSLLEHLVRHQAGGIGGIPEGGDGMLDRFTSDLEALVPGEGALARNHDLCERKAA